MFANNISKLLSVKTWMSEGVTQSHRLASRLQAEVRTADYHIECLKYFGAVNDDLNIVMSDAEFIKAMDLDPLVLICKYKGRYDMAALLPKFFPDYAKTTWGRMESTFYAWARDIELYKMMFDVEVSQAEIDAVVEELQLGVLV